MSAKKTPTRTTPATKNAKSPLKAPAKPPRPAPKAAKASATAKRAAPAKRASTKAAAPAKRGAAKTGPMARRADFGAPVDGFIAKQPPDRRALLEKLRGLVQAAAPDAVGALKWGMPMFTIDGRMMCGLGAHKAHVNLILAGQPGTFSDPEGRLEGEGKTGRRLVLQTLADLPEKSVRGWLKAAADNARKG